ncbi:MAG: diguanylate cyclase [Nitrosomonas sp.]|nr:diguanylate cyclase [Nitrosomonas sp.]MCW5608188.1 diguanylate cyclase [Nitrosomonas sp.]
MKIINIDQLNIRDSLPSPKGVALAIVQMCRNDDISIHEITRLIQTDPTLSYRLIHRANLTRNTSRQISSVSDAVFHLGIQSVKQLALSFSLIDQYQQGNCKAFDYHQFWSHSLLMAIASEAFGNVIRISVREELFTCGLLARIGCLALATIYPQKYSEILGINDTHRSLIEKERQYLETDHNHMTVAMLVDAGFAMELIESVYYHEEPMESGFFEDSRSYQLTQLFHLAKHLADITILAESEYFEQTAELMLLAKRIGFQTKSFIDIVQNIIQEWKNWNSLLKISDTTTPCPQTITRTIEQFSGNNQNASSLRVLVIEDDPASRRLIEEILSNILGHTVFSAENGQQGLSLGLETMPHVVITDWIMPVMDGLELTRALRATDWGKNTYIIMLTGVEEEKLAKAFEIGVDDYITKPINIHTFRARLRAAWHHRRLQDSWQQNQMQLKQSVAELSTSNRKLEQAAHTDILTGLPNRRAGMEALSRAWSIASRTYQLIAAILIDIDYFKRINDSHGHAAGDVVLKAVAASIQNTARKGDFFCRIGGEEFLIICQDKKTNLRSTAIFAERLRQKIGSEYIDIHGKTVTVTISIGIALKEPYMQNEDQLIKAADKALYTAKDSGRNKIFCANGDHFFEPDPGDA